MYAVPIEEHSAKFAAIYQRSESWTQIFVELVVNFMMKIPLLFVWEKLVAEIVVTHDV